MKTKLYDTPYLEVLEVSLEMILCTSAVEDDLDFSALGSEGIVDSGHTINWGK